jgi:putative flippase GtrA
MKNGENPVRTIGRCPAGDEKENPPAKGNRDQARRLFLVLFAGNGVFREFLRFSFVGLVGLAINLAILYSLVEWFPFWPKLGNFIYARKVLLSAALAFCVAMISNYALNRAWTFKKRPEGVSFATSFLRFALVSLGGLLINIMLLNLLHYRLGIWYMWGQVIAIGAASLWNFLGSKIWAFRSF